MTATLAMKLIGRTGTISIKGMNVAVSIIDIKWTYGKTRYLVSPLYGNGETWVEYVSMY